MIRSTGSFESYDRVRIVDLAAVEIDALDGLEALLCRLERRRDCCVVRGAIADRMRTRGVRRLLHRDRATGDEPTLREEPQRWAALDFDGLPQPDWIDYADLPGCACVAVAALPDEFRRVRFIVQATAGHGLKPGIHVRLWCWLSRPTTGAELKYWLRSAPVDGSIFGAAQVIYTAAPVFLPGSFDPLLTRLDVVPGEAAVIVPARLRPPKPRKTRGDRGNGDTIEIDRLVRFVAGAAVGNRNSALYWAACHAAENGGAERAAALLAEAAVGTGLPTAEAAATVRSGLRHG
jgi:hypothetical protein